MIDWELLRPHQRGLVVEGKTDEQVIPKFFHAGEKAFRWQNWQNQVLIQQAGGVDLVLRELETPLAKAGRIWGIIDRDWRSDSEITDLKIKYGNQLIVLPRIHIENYFIDPVELETLLSPHVAIFPLFRQAIESALDDWLKQGAMARTLYESGVEDFCDRGGYKLLRHVPVPDDNRIQAHLVEIHQQIEPTQLFTHYQIHLNDSRNSKKPYHEGISGKLFFQQIVVNTLNKHYSLKNTEQWLDNLGDSLSDCPADLIPLLQPMVI
jgi:hypothetical protein